MTAQCRPLRAGLRNVSKLVSIAEQRCYRCGTADKWRAKFVHKNKASCHRLSVLAIMLIKSRLRQHIMTSSWQTHDSVNVNIRQPR